MILDPNWRDSAAKKNLQIAFFFITHNQQHTTRNKHTLSTVWRKVHILFPKSPPWQELQIMTPFRGFVRDKHLSIQYLWRWAKSEITKKL